MLVEGLTLVTVRPAFAEAEGGHYALRLSTYDCRIETVDYLGRPAISVRNL
jgi:hypothetical protein